MMDTMPSLAPTPPPPPGASLFDIAGRVALVTGSSRGIRHALAGKLSVL
jgi:hypothetical protein